MLTLADYKILSRIHERQRYTIYRAVNSDGKSFTIKALNSRNPQVEEIAFLYHEYEVTRNIELPHVLKTYTFIAEQNQYAIVQEDIQGISLAEYLRQHPIRELSVFFTIAFQILSAIGEVHKHKIIHKDINPENIIIEPNTLLIKLANFTFATKLVHESQEVISPDKLEGSLAYMAPEQTGRMNIIIDYRADYYALGVTFYVMLTGALPFLSTDPLKLIHDHLAKAPPEASEKKGFIAKSLSKVIVKLMSKDPAERYQSTFGIKTDLERIAKGENDTFELGLADLHDHLNLSQKLYGRQAETTLLLKKYEHVSQGAVEVLMVSGYSGIGKTILINEVHKPMAEHKGYFVTGKFDQLQKNTPYTAISQAMNQLAKHIMSESDEHFNQVKTKISEAVGECGQVIIDLAPEFERILGKQPPLAKVTSKETQNRMMMFFKKFLECMATKDHPLVMFIDDLQWIDSGSLKLLEYIITDESLGHLFFIGAYRDSELDDHNLFLQFLNEAFVQKRIDFLCLHPLKVNDFTALFCDSFYRDKKSVQSFAEIIHKRTGGNPFFCKQVINTLYKLNILYFDYKNNHWDWDLQAINELVITDNVVDLMIAKVKDLPEDTRRLLEFAACAGFRFSIEILIKASGLFPEKITKLLWPAIAQELIVTLGTGHKRLEALSQADIEPVLLKEILYQFIHDKVHQAIYETISIQERAAIHLSIARSIMKSDPTGCEKERLFEVTDHYNQAHQLLNGEERLLVVDLNYKAGMLALYSNAYKPMLNYLKSGCELTSEQWWQDKYELMFGLFRGHYQALFLNGETRLSDSIGESLLEHAKTDLDKASVYRIRCMHLLSERDLKGALVEGVKAIALLGINININPSKFQRMVKLLKIKWLLRNYKIETLDGDLKELTDPKIIAVFDILTEIVQVSFLLPGVIHIGLSLEAMELMLKYGSGSSAGLWVTMYAVTIMDVFRNIDQSTALLSLADRFIDKKSDKYMSASAYIYGTYWIRHVKDSFTVRSNYYHLAIRQALDSGNLLSAGIAMGCEVTALWLRGKSCSELLHFMEKSLAYFCQIHMNDNITRTSLRIAIVQAYISQSYVDDTIMNAYETVMSRNNEYYKIQAYTHLATYFYFTERYDEAYKYHLKWYADEEKMRNDENCFHQKTIDALTMSQLILSTPRNKCRTYLKKLVRFHKDLQWAASFGKDNYLHQYLLLDGVLEMVKGNTLKALRSFNQAIQNARKGDFFLWLGICNEIAGKMLLHENLQLSAASYIREACYYYKLYGMNIKVQLLEQHCPPGFQAEIEEYKPTSISVSHSPDTSTFHSNLDLMTIIKASQAISSEIFLEKLLKKMLRIVSESAGAEKTILLEVNNNNWIVTAMLDRASFQTYQVPLKEFLTIPQTIIQLALRSEKPVNLSDARNESDFKEDVYIKSVQPKSVLCVPISHQNQMIGLIYLENNLVTGSFNTQRVTLITVLASQIAISLQNSHHLERMQHLYKKTERFVPKPFLELLEKKSIEDVQLGDSKLIDLTVMFADIRDFTSLSEKLGPKKLSSLINSYLGRMAPIIRKQGGFVGHFLGDGILALFPQSAEDALIASLEMQNALSFFNLNIEADGFEPIEVGVGLDCGSAMLSILGEAQRLDANVLGDVINEASRIESLNKIYKTRLLISGSVYLHLTNRSKYLIRKIDKVYVKGKTRGLEIYEVIQLANQAEIEGEREYLTLFNQAFSLYEKSKFVTATDAFSKCVEIKSSDYVAQLLLNRCKDFQKFGPPKGWDGVIRMLEK